eukprot:6003710-Amphidinium_carterae.1
MIVDLADVVCVQELHLARPALRDASHVGLKLGYKMLMTPAIPTHGHGTMGGVAVGARPHIGLQECHVPAAYHLLQGRISSALLGGILHGGVH